MPKLTYKVDGTPICELELEVGADITAQVAPEKEGYDFSLDSYYFMRDYAYNIVRVLFIRVLFAEKKATPRG